MKVPVMGAITGNFSASSSTGNLPVVVLTFTLKAWFSHLISTLNMGGININSALKVGIMRHSLLAKYQAVVQEYHFGPHTLADTRLQRVVKQCNNYNKDPWKGLTGKDGKSAHTPSANAAEADHQKTYKALPGKSFSYHLGQWKKALKDQKSKCMVCLDRARNSDHKMCDCPILKADSDQTP
jgi:hypothetical protein